MFSGQISVKDMKYWITNLARFTVMIYNNMFLILFIISMHWTGEPASTACYDKQGGLIYCISHPNAGLVSWCFEPSQPQRITSGLNTNFTPSPNYSFHKSSYHKSCFLSLSIFLGRSIWEHASSRMTYFILQAYTGTGVSHSQHTTKLGEGLEKCRWMDQKGRNKQGRNYWQ